MHVRYETSSESPLVRRLIAGLSWSGNPYGLKNADLDLSVFLLAADGKVSKDSDFIFYNQPQHDSGAVVHLGDNRSGLADTEAEQVIIDTELLPASIEKVVLAVSIHDRTGKNLHFGQFNGAYTAVSDEESGEELCYYDLSEDFSTQSAVAFCELVRRDQDWFLNASSSAFAPSLYDLCVQYGVHV